MTTALLITCIGAFALAAVNGANDVSKGIATLVGSSVTGYRRAIRWGTICTALGGSAAIVSTNAMGVGRQTPLNKLHWFSSGITSFARGMNDAPKIGTNASAAAAVSRSAAFGVIIAGMVVGSIIGGWRVTEVLAKRIVQPTPRQGFAASVVTATLVIGGAIGGLPMSTTHVSASAIAATGIERGAGALNGKTLRRMAFAWVVTLPGAGVFSAAVYASLHACGF